MLSRFANWLWGSTPETKKTVATVATNNTDIKIGETNPGTQPDDVLPPADKTPDVPSTVPAGDHISMIQSELEAKAKEYEDELNAWSDILEKRLEQVYEPDEKKAEIAATGIKQKIIDIFKAIIDALRKTKEAVELPSTFIADKLAEAKGHFDVLLAEVKALESSYESVSCPMGKKQILVDISRKAFDILHDLQTLDIQTISEIKYVKMFRRAAEKLPLLIDPKLSVFANLLDDKAIEELTDNEIYREISAGTDQIKEHMANARALLQTMKAFVIKKSEMLKPTNNNGIPNPHVMFQPAKPGSEVVVAPTVQQTATRRLGQGS